MWFAVGVYAVGGGQGFWLGWGLGCQHVAPPISAAQQGRGFVEVRVPGWVGSLGRQHVAHPDSAAQQVRF